jgi:hypothetical protein
VSGQLQKQYTLAIKVSVIVLLNHEWLVAVINVPGFLGMLFLLRSFGFMVVICLMCSHTQTISNPLGLGAVSHGVKQPG